MLITASVDFVYISRRVRRTEQNGCFVCIGKSEAEVTNNKCIGDDTKAAARQSPNYIKKTKKLNTAKNDFQYGRWNSFTLQCGTWLWDDMPSNSPKRPAHWNSASGFDFDHITSVDMSFCASLRHFIQIGPPSA